MKRSSDDTPTTKTYRQNWPAYNAAQVHEKEHFLKLLHALCENLEEPKKQVTGRPRLPIGDAVFTACFKVYSGFSGRRFMTDLRDAETAGYISRTPHFNTIYAVMDDPDITKILHDMIETTSLPLAEVEHNFAADSSGFTASRVTTWQDHKYGGRRQHSWCKVHLMCGTKTNVVTAVKIEDKYAGDAKMLPDLVRRTGKNFVINKVLADKAYGSFRNYDVISEYGAVPYIPFKENHISTIHKNVFWKGITPEGVRFRKMALRKNALWHKMHALFLYNQPEYMRHYHKRSNVEATFSMIKAKFGGFVRSKTETAMANECLCKIIAHNICTLIHATYELGVEINFSPQEPAIV